MCTYMVYLLSSVGIQYLGLGALGDWLLDGHDGVADELVQRLLHHGIHNTDEGDDKKTALTFVCLNEIDLSKCLIRISI